MKYFFKYHLYSKHYALIVSKKDGKYGFLLLTHKQREKSRSNLCLSHNPDAKSKELAFIQKGLRFQSTSNFSKKKANHLCLSLEDEAMVTNFLEEKRRRNEQTHKDEEERER